MKLFQILKKVEWTYPSVLNAGVADRLRRTDGDVHSTFGKALLCVLVGLVFSAVLSAQETRELWVPSDHLETILKQKPRAVFLTPEQYKTLSTDSQRAVLADEKEKIQPPVPATVRSVAMVGKIQPGADVVAVTANYEVESFTDDWTEIPLVMPLSHLGHIEVDEQSALRSTKAPNPILLTHGKGIHRVKAIFHLPVTRTPGGESIEVHSPGVASAGLTLQVPEGAKLKSPLPFHIEEQKAGFTIPSQTNGCWKIEWTAKKVATIPGAALFQTCSYLYSFDSTRLQADLGLILNSSLTELPTAFTIAMPEELRVLSVEGSELLSWDRQPGGQVNIKLLPGDRETADLRFRVEQDLAVPGNRSELTVTLPIASIDGVHRASGTMTMLGSDDVRINQISTGPLTVSIPDDAEGPASNLPNYVASFRFPVQQQAPAVSLSKVQDRFNAQLDTLISLKREAIYMDRTLVYLPLEGNVFEAVILLPADEEIVSVVSPERKDFTWKESNSQLNLRWDSGLTDASPATVKISTRRDPDNWYQLSATATDLHFDSIEVVDAESLSGYVAVAFDSSFQVETGATEGLSPRDGRNTPVKGNLAWFRLDDFSLDLKPGRKPAEVEAYVTSYVLPLANILEIEGQIGLDIQNSGIRELVIETDPLVSEYLRFDSPAIAQQLRDETTGAWTLTFHEEQSGVTLIRYTMNLPLEVTEVAETEGEKKFDIAMPRLAIKAAKRTRGDWIMEANTDTELIFTTEGLDAVDSLSVPKVTGYEPRHRIIAAFQYRGDDWKLEMSGTRHPHSELVTTVIDLLEIDTVVSTDGTDRHQTRLAVRSAGDQFLEIRMPKHSVLWSLSIDGERTKPVRSGRDQLRVQLPAHEDSRKAIEISVIYQTPGRNWAGSGLEKLLPITVSEAIPVMKSNWRLHLPEGFDYQRFQTNLQQDFEINERILLGHVAGKIGDWRNRYDGRTFSTGRELDSRRPLNPNSIDDLIEQASSGPGIAIDPQIATNYVIRMQESVKRADDAALRGSQLIADGDFESGVEQYNNAIDLLPDAPMTAQRRRAYLKQYSRAATTLARSYADGGRYNEALGLIEDVLRPTVSPDNLEAKRLLEQLSDPEYYSPALTPAHLERVRKVKLALKTGQGYLDYGDYDRAEREYHKALNIDRYNSAARRSLEDVERRRLNYYDAARDQTRSTFLRKIAEEWELPVPTAVDMQDISIGSNSATQDITRNEDKLRSIIIPSLEFSDTPLRDALEFIQQKSVELDFNESDINRKGVNIILSAESNAVTNPDSGIANTPITLRLTNVPLGEALRYTTNLAQLKYKVESHAVVVVPLSTPDSDLFTNQYTVPPTFLSSGSGGGGGAAVDPFAPEPSANGPAATRMTVKQILENAGITFAPGSTAIYNPSTSTLIVRNTSDQMDLVESYIESIKTGPPMSPGSVFRLPDEEESSPGSGLKSEKYAIAPEIYKKLMGGGIALGDVADSFAADPFAPAPQQDMPARPQSPKDAMESAGITFPPGAGVDFDPATGELTITNTRDQADLVEAYLSSLDEGRPIIQVTSKFIETEPGEYRPSFIGSSSMDGMALNSPDDLPKVADLFNAGEVTIAENRVNLESTIIENVDFKDKTVEEAIDLLEARIRATPVAEAHAAAPLTIDLDLEKKGEVDPAKKKLNFSLAKATALEVLDKIVGESDTRYFVTKGGVVIADRNTEILPMETVFIPMPARVFQSVNDDGSIHDHHARNVLKTAGINFPRGSSAAYNPSTGRLAVRNTKENLEAVISQYAAEMRAVAQNPDAPENDLRFSSEFLGGASDLKGFNVADIGRLPIDFELPQSGRMYQFHGLYAPDGMGFRYVNWERQIRVAWVWIFAGLLAFLFGAWRWVKMPLFVGVLIIVLLTFLPLIVSEGLAPFCNSLLIGWIMGIFGWLVYLIVRKLSPGETDWKLPAVPELKKSWRLFFLIPIALSATSLNGAAEDKVIKGHTVYVPYDPEKPVSEQKAERYYLDYETFEHLWKRVKAYRMERDPDGKPEGEKSGYTLSTALYRLTSTPKRLSVSGRLSLLTQGKDWQRVPLNFKGANLSSIKLDGKAASLQNGGILVEKSGSHLVEVEFELPFEDGQDSAEWTIPKSPGVMMEISMDSDLAEPVIQKNWPLAKSTPEGNRTLYTAAIGQQDKISFRRRLKTSGRSMSRPYSAIIDANLFVAQGLEQLEATYRLNFEGQEDNRFSIAFEKTFTPVGFDIPNLSIWEIKDDPDSGLRELTFFLTQPVRDSLVVKFTGERLTEAGDRQFPRLSAGASRIEQKRHLLKAVGLTILPRPGVNHRQIPGPQNPSGFLPVSSYSLTGKNEDLSYIVSDKRAERTAEMTYVYQLGAGKLETIAQFQVRSPEEPLLNLSVTVPADAKVQRLEGNRIKDWWRTDDELNIRFSGGTPEVTALMLYLTQEVEDSENNFTLPIGSLPIVGFADDEVTGVGLVVAHTTRDVSLNFQDTQKVIRELGPNEVAKEFEILPPMVRKRGFRFEKMNFSGGIVSSKLAPRFNALWVLLARVHESWVHLSVHTDIEVVRSGLDRFSFQTSTEVPEFRIPDDDIREVRITEADGVRNYEVIFQQFVPDAISFTLEAELPHSGDAVLPDIKIPGADRQERYLIVENMSSGRMDLTPGNLDSTVMSLLPYRPDTLVTSQLFRARPNWSLTASLEKLDTSAGNEAVILYAELTSAFRSSGEEWLKAVYHIQNRSLQFLPVAVPKNAELVSVVVGDAEVRADKGKVDGNDVILVPLIQTKPGQLAYDVKLVFRSRAGSGKSGKRLKRKLDDPNVFGTTIEKTIWKVHLPAGHELADFKGNMQPIDEEESDLRKLQSDLSELKGLNWLSTRKGDDAQVQIDSNDNAQILADRIENRLKQVQKNDQAVEFVEIEKELDQQKIVITENRIEMPVFRQSGRVGLNIQDTEKSKSIAWVDNSGEIKARNLNYYDVARDQTQRLESQLRVNDNISLGNKFFNNAQAEVGKVAGEPLSGSQRMEQIGHLSQNPKAAAVQQKLAELNNTQNFEQVGTGDKISQESKPAMDSKKRPDVQAYSNARSAFKQIGHGGRSNAPEDQQEEVMNAEPDPFGGGGGGAAQTQPAQADSIGYRDGFNRVQSEGQQGTVAQSGNEALFGNAFKATGRRSVSVDFPVEGEAFYFQKLKDHAELRIVSKESRDSGRIAAFFGMLTLLGLVVLVKAFFETRERASNR